METARSSGLGSGLDYTLARCNSYKIAKNSKQRGAIGQVSHNKSSDTRPLRSLRNSEVKYFDKGSDATTIQTAATTTMPAHSGIASLVTLAQGDTDVTRNGNLITIRKLILRGFVGVDLNSDPDRTLVVADTVHFRVILFIDHQCNGASAQSTDLFETSLVSEDAFDLYYNTSDQQRFTILSDKVIKVNPAVCFMDTTPVPDTIVAMARYKHFEMSHNLNLPIRYGDGTANMASVRSNNIGIYVLCSGGGGANTTTQRKFAYRARVLFTDY